MSAAKMVADSTQSDEPATKKNKISVKKNKKAKKTAEKKSSKKKSSMKEESTDPNLDLSRVILPIGDYWKNRVEMLEQMFDAVQGPSFSMILPDVLNDMNIKELKRQCLEHLEVMSKKRIFRILAGDDPDNISSSGTEDEGTAEGVYPGGQDNNSQQAADSTSNSQTDINKDLVKDGVSDQLNQQNLTDKDAGSKPQYDSPRNTEDDGTISADGHKTSLELATMSCDENNKISILSSQTEHIDCEMDQMVSSEEEGECCDTHENDSESGSLIPMLTQNHMELLELEMRARAIKAMLKAQESHSSHPT